MIVDNKQILSEIVVQIFGFLIVFGVLKRFAWGKIMQVIDARRQKIEDGFTDIEKQKDGLQTLEQDYRQKLENIEQEARAKIQEAAQEGQRVGTDIQEKAREEAKKLLERAKAEIKQDMAKAKIEMRDEVIEISGLMTEKILKQKLTEKEHEKLVDQFVKELEKVS